MSQQSRRQFREAFLDAMTYNRLSSLEENRQESSFGDRLINAMTWRNGRNSDARWSDPNATKAKPKENHARARIRGFPAPSFGPLILAYSGTLTFVLFATDLSALEAVLMAVVVSVAAEGLTTISGHATTKAQRVTRERNRNRTDDSDTSS